MSIFLQCDAPVRGDKCQIRQRSNRSQLQFYGRRVGIFVPLQEQFQKMLTKAVMFVK